MTSSQPALTNLVAFSGLGLTLAALGLSAIRRRILIDAIARDLVALTQRVAALEATRDRGNTNRPMPARADPQVVSGPVLISVPNLAVNHHVVEEPLRDEVSSDLSRRFAAICELADAGNPPKEIARATGQPIGQVELVLGLKRRRHLPRGPRLP